jgi:hypothetical protein
VFLEFSAACSAAEGSAVKTFSAGCPVEKLFSILARVLATESLPSAPRYFAFVFHSRFVGPAHGTSAYNEQVLSKAAG